MFNIFTREGLISFLYFLPALLISLAVHEFSHAYTAYKLGDKSQKARGRLTLNPISHMDWWGFLCIVLLGFGWGKPVMVDDSNFKNRAKGNMLTALAGPMSNLLMAILFTIILKVLMVTGVINTAITTTAGTVLMNMFVLAIQFNVVFFVFNMLPIPPFDGSKVLFYFLPSKWKGIMYTLERYSFFIIIILLVTDLHLLIMGPITNLIMKLLDFIILI